jgi:hypothetical protein
MKNIGGFFGLEKLRKREKPFLHKNAIPLASGRASLNFILQHLRPSRLYVPFYTCNALLEPIRLNKIPYVFYSINEYLEPADKIVLHEDEYLVYVNYFGIKSDTVAKLVSKFGRNLIIDNSQAFFEPELKGAFSFNSARKFFGVPDGSFLYLPEPVACFFEENKNISTNHLINRALGNMEMAYQEFLDYERSITCDIRSISSLSHKILKTIDYRQIAEIRRANYLYLQDQLGKDNTLSLNISLEMVPLCYPFFPDRFLEKKTFYEQGIFIPTFWTDVVDRDNSGFELEKNISRCLLPLPIDHRYNTKDLCSVLKFVEESSKE